MIRAGMVGRTLAHYRVIKPLGHGGMGEVYLADDVRLKRPVALKILPVDVATDPVRLERFEREAQVVAALNHPNIVTVHSIERADGALFMTMEYLDGRTLAEIIPSHGLPLARLLSLAMPIVDAVIAAHGQGVVHRDLKPANVMVLTGDRVKVLDFGLAKLRERPGAEMLPTRELTGDGRIVGTVAYMSPEQAEGKVVDERSDIFAMGVMLYEMATGERAFIGETSLSVLSSILRDTPRAVTELNPAMPRDAWRIVRHCLAKDPDRRYQTAKDLRNDLEDLAQSLSSGELAAVSPVPAAPSSRRRLRITLGLALIAMIAFGMAAWLRPSPPGGNSAPPTLSHTRLTQKEGVERSPTISPDGKWVVYSTDGDLFLQSVTGQTAINLTTDSPSNETTPAFSPDGETIAFRSTREGGGIFLMGRTGESVKRLTNDGFSPAWFPDGQSIVYASGEAPQGPENRVAFSELWTVPVNGGGARRLFAGDAVQPRVSPHGNRIAFWSMPADAVTKYLGPGNEPANRDIWTIDASGNNPLRVAAHDANDWNPVWSPDGRWLYFLSNRSGSMGLWRIAIDESSGVASGEPQPLATPAWYVADFNVSADGTTAVYVSLVSTNNVARLGFDPATATIKGETEMITSGTNDFAYLDVTKDGQHVALTTTSRTREDLYVLAVADRSVRQLTNDFARDRWPRWTSDGRSIFFYSDRRGYEVWRINADGSDLRQVTHEPGLKQMYPSLSADGSRMAASDQDVRKITIYDTHDFDKPFRVMTPAIDRTIGPLQIHDWSPDGRSFLFVAGAPGAQLNVWQYSVDTGTTMRLAECSFPTWMKDGRRLVCTRPTGAFVVDVRTGATRALGFRPLPGGLRLAADDRQLFFLSGAISADVWVARFDQLKPR